MSIVLYNGKKPVGYETLFHVYLHGGQHKRPPRPVIG